MAFGRSVTGLVLFGLIGGPASALPQAQAEPDLAKGIRLVEEGDYDAAVLTLDQAARRLAASPSRQTELAQAYLHLGIAYLGKGHAAVARAKFREALLADRNQSITPDRFPPKVVDLYEAARAELRSQGVPASAPASPVARQQGRSKAPFILGGLALAGGGAALALGGGAQAQAASPAASGPTAETFTGNLSGGDNLSFPFRLSAGGMLEATLTWTNPGAVLGMDLHVPGAIVASSARTGATSASLSASVGAQGYTLQVLQREPCQACATSFELRVVHP